MLFRRKTTEVDDRLKTAITRIIHSGIETNQFRPVDAEMTADHISFLIKQGLHTRTTMNRDNAVERTQTIIDEIIMDISRED